jgi:hypothetical protein
MRESFVINTKKEKDKYLALHAMCKEKTEDIIEWINYHKTIGVEHFILYNNNSNEHHLYDSLPKNLHSITTIVNWFYDMDGRQILAQKHCIKHNQNFRWIGFLDIDEYIVPLQESNIANILKSYEEYDGLCLHWLLFGSNGLLTRQNSTIYSYTQSCPNHGANEHIKSIINPKKYTGYHYDPHFITTSNSVNVNKEKVTDAFGSTRQNNRKPILDKVMRINHYYTKSLEDFSYKRDRKGGNLVNRIYSDKHFDSIQKENVYNDDIIKVYSKMKNYDRN